jgi:two-component system probable response regulator PhcQ
VHVKVLVYVDDEPALCRIVARVLARTGARVHTFTDPREALAFLQTTVVDAVISDYRMPEMTGIELLQQLARDVPFFIISGDLWILDEVGHIPRVTGVLQKPVRPEELLAVIASA